MTIPSTSDCDMRLAFLNLFAGFLKFSSQTWDRATSPMIRSKLQLPYHSFWEVDHQPHTRFTDPSSFIRLLSFQVTPSPSFHIICKMRSTIALLALAGCSHAFPFEVALKKRQTLSSFDDVAILNYALTLEHLEDKFYREALGNFTQAEFAAAGFDSVFYNNLVETSSDETIHVAFLSGALSAAGATPVKECTYAFGVTSVETFVATASIFEGLGVAAYLGAAAQIASKAYLTAAGSVLTVEARHSSYLRQFAWHPYQQQ